MIFGMVLDCPSSESEADLLQRAECLEIAKRFCGDLLERMVKQGFVPEDGVASLEDVGMLYLGLTSLLLRQKGYRHDFQVLADKVCPNTFGSVMVNDEAIGAAARAAVLVDAEVK